MGKWSKSLPMPLANHTDRAANALYFIGMSMMDSFPERNQVANIRRAAAEVRAWRKSLGVKSERASFTPRGGARASLRSAAWSVLTADGSKDNAVLVTTYLRYAEAHLREAALLLDKE